MGQLPSAPPQPPSPRAPTPLCSHHTWSPAPSSAPARQPPSPTQLRRPPLSLRIRLAFISLYPSTAAVSWSSLWPSPWNRRHSSKSTSSLPRCHPSWLLHHLPASNSAPTCSSRQLLTETRTLPWPGISNYIHFYDHCYLLVVDWKCQSCSCSDLHFAFCRSLLIGRRSSEVSACSDLAFPSFDF